MSELPLADLDLRLRRRPGRPKKPEPPSASPPANGHVPAPTPLRTGCKGPSHVSSMPPHLVEELGQLWAEILVAEFKRRREIAGATVESPTGIARKTVHPLVLTFETIALAS